MVTFDVSLLQVSLVATGPLTNLALAIRIDPTISQKLKGLYIMGGNTECKSSTSILVVYWISLMIYYYKELPLFYALR